MRTTADTDQQGLRPGRGGRPDRTALTERPIESPGGRPRAERRAPGPGGAGAPAGTAGPAPGPGGPGVA